MLLICKIEIKFINRRTMPNSDTGVWIIAFVVLIFLWQPLVALSMFGAYAVAYVFYMAVLFWIPMLISKVRN